MKTKYQNKRPSSSLAEMPPSEPKHIFEKMLEEGHAVRDSSIFSVGASEVKIQRWAGTCFPVLCRDPLLEDWQLKPRTSLRVYADRSSFVDSPPLTLSLGWSHWSSFLASPKWDMSLSLGFGFLTKFKSHLPYPAWPMGAVGGGCGCSSNPCQFPQTFQLSCHLAPSC